MTIRPDPTFHASPKLAMEAPPESLAFVPCIYAGTDVKKPDYLAVVNVDDLHGRHGHLDPRP